MCCVCPQVSITFSGNAAIIGPAISISQLNLCSWYTRYPPYFNESSQVLRWPIMSYKYVCACTLYVCTYTTMHYAYLLCNIFTPYSQKSYFDCYFANVFKLITCCCMTVQCIIKCALFTTSLACLFQCIS